MVIYREYQVITFTFTFKSFSRRSYPERLTNWTTQHPPNLTSHDYSPCFIQWSKKVFSQPPIVQVLPLKKMREACNFHHRYTSTMTDKMRKKNPENHIVGFFMNLFANYGGK